MISIENFKKLKVRDLLIIVILAALWFLVAFLMNSYLDPQLSYILSLLVVTMLMSFCAILIKKAGVATLFYAVGGILTYRINDLGVVGIDKLIVLVVAGIIFEIFFLILKIEVKNLPVDVVIGTALSSATIPLTIGFLISVSAAMNMAASMVNLALLSLLIGVIGSILSFLTWHNARTNKFFLRFEYNY